MYDFLIVGAGLFGATFAHKARSKGYKCLVIDKRKHVGGNLYCENINGINVHKYGAHIFHTSNKQIWDFVNGLVDFNRYTNSPIANYQGRIFNLPFNMNTFYQLWGVVTPSEAKKIIEHQKNRYVIDVPSNLEEQAISLVGEDIYKILIKEYTEKQWGRSAKELPSFIIKRLPVRFNYDNNYFDDLYQGIPCGGYNALIDKLLEGIEVRTSTDYFKNKSYFDGVANKVVYTGPIDEYFDFCYGKLEYRSLKFEEEHLDIENYQGNAVVNFTSKDVPYTRIIEHKHFEFGNQASTVITKEYPSEWENGKDPYYPVNDPKNEALYQRYKLLAASEKRVIFGGRLAEYKYYDMDDIIENVFKLI